MNTIFCAECGAVATRVEYLYLDWQQRGSEILCYRVGACEDHRVVIASKIATRFQRYVAGSIFRIDRVQGTIKRLLIWTDTTNDWSRRRAAALFNRLRKPGFRRTYANGSIAELSLVNRLDWRGTYPLPNGQRLVYNMRSVEDAEFERETIEALIRTFCKRADDWQPTYIDQLPPKKRPKR